MLDWFGLFQQAVSIMLVVEMSVAPPRDFLDGKDVVVV